MKTTPWLRPFLLFVIATVLYPTCSHSANILRVPDNATCACPGEVLTYSCSVIGGGNTVWNGTAFNCGSSGMLNEISLRHTQFDHPGGATGSCNNDAIMAQSIGVVNNCYTSNLTVRISTTLNNTSIQCTHDSSEGQLSIGSSVVLVMTAPEPPSYVRFTDVRNGQIVLTWSRVESICAPTYYSVISNCTNITCSGATNLTTDGCLLLQQLTGVFVCAFRVQSMVCGNHMGSVSSPAVVTLKEPTLTIVSRYFSNNSLSRFTVLGSNLRVAKSDSVNVFITTYNVTFSDPHTGNVIYSAPFSTCGEDTCETDITPPSLSQVCPLLTITVTSDYKLGYKLLSDPITVGCTNRFIDIRYNSADSTMSCVLLNPTNTSSKSCRVTYGPCGQEQTQSVEGVSSADLSNNNIIVITLEVPRGSFCYTATASSDNFIIVVEGMIEKGATQNVGAIVGGVVAGLCGIVLIVVIIMLMLSSRRRMKSDGFLQMSSITPTVEDKLKLKPITDRDFKKLDIDSKDCELRDTVEYNKKKFVRGRAYYEFVHEQENISEDKELIFMKKDTDYYFSPMISVDVLHEYNLLGEGVERPEYESYKVFVQSTGSGARHLPAGSLLLYEQVQSNPWNPEKAPLQQVISDHFMTTTITSDCTVQKFQTKVDLRVNGANVFIEFNHGNTIIEDFRDAILMDKKTGKFFTGPTARLNPSAYLDKYRVFVLLSNTEKVKLESGRTVLHQNPTSRENLQFHVLEVDKDVQMAKFVEDKLGVKFDNGRAFYEFRQMEDFLFYRDVVIMPKSPEKHEFNFKSSVRRFYWLSTSVPGIGIKPPNLDQYQVFVQSTSQGSRYLKAGTLLLYKYYC